MYSVIDIAKFFLYLNYTAGNTEIGDHKLQMVCAYANTFYRGLRDARLISEQTQKGMEFIDDSTDELKVIGIPYYEELFVFLDEICDTSADDFFTDFTTPILEDDQFFLSQIFEMYF
jgi:hypothetical protein